VKHACEMIRTSRILLVNRPKRGQKEPPPIKALISTAVIHRKAKTLTNSKVNSKGEATGAIPICKLLPNPALKYLISVQLQSFASAFGVASVLTSISVSYTTLCHAVDRFPLAL